MAPVSPFNFRFSPMGFVFAFVDGCILNNGVAGKPKRGGIGVFFAPNNELNFIGAVDGPPTTSKAEIQAAIKAVTLCKEAEFQRVMIKSGSEDFTTAMNERIHYWINNNWQTPEGKPVENVAEYKRLLEVSKDIEVKYVHVASPAENGSDSDEDDVYGNESAHHLATKGAIDARPYNDNEY